MKEDHQSFAPSGAPIGVGKRQPVRAIGAPEGVLIQIMSIRQKLAHHERMARLWFRISTWLFAAWFLGFIVCIVFDWRFWGVLLLVLLPFCLNGIANAFWKKHEKEVKRAEAEIVYLRRKNWLEKAGLCVDCGMPISGQGEPPNGWALEDGRIVCGPCCVKDLQEIRNTVGETEKNQ